MSDNPVSKSCPSAENRDAAKGGQAQKESPMAQQKQHRSVNDFTSEEALYRALYVQSSTAEDAGAVADDAVDQNGLKRHEQSSEWTLDVCDPATEDTVTLDDEIKRLSVLKSYFLLDVEQEDTLDMITEMASRIFDVPVCIISLVDLGRLWFVSNRGLGNTRMIPRKNAFCSHAILNKGNMLVVPDATLDERFADNPIVTGGPQVRFYAGAPLFCPEGYRVGNFCLVDPTARPQGLSAAEQYTLTDLANLAVLTMVDRRDKILLRQKHEQMVSYTAHDLMTPLTGLHLSLSLLGEDVSLAAKLDGIQRELLHTSCQCADILTRICQDSVETMRADVAPEYRIGSGTPTTTTAACHLADLVHCLHQVLDPIPKQVPVVLSIDDSAPEVVCYDELKTFRAALNFLNVACARTETGSVTCKISYDEPSELVFEFEDTATIVDAKTVAALFCDQQQHEDVDQRLVALSYASKLVTSMGGRCGHRPRFSAGRRHGSNFWFRVPVQVHREHDAAVADISTERTPALDPPPLWSSPNAKHSASPMCPTTPVGLPHTVTVPTHTTVPGKQHPCSVSVSSQSGGDHWQRHAHRAVATHPMYGTMEAGSSSIMRMEVEAPTGSDGGVVHGRHTAVGTENSAARNIKVDSITAPPPSKRIKRALVIDDSLVVRKSLGRALANLGYDVSLANDGMEGLNALKETVFDFTLCDFLMPVMDGLDCVKQYRAWEQVYRPRCRQHIVGISAHANESDLEHGLTSGMDYFLSKPVTIKRLKMVLEDEAVVSISRRLDSMVVRKQDNSTTMDDTDSLNESTMDDSRDAQKDSRLWYMARKADLRPPGVPPMPSSHVFSSPPPAWQHSDGGRKVCLIAALSSQCCADAHQMLFSNGWDCEYAGTAEEAFRQLQTRNWDAVLIDDSVCHAPGGLSIDQFRQWERDNRINRQKNLFLHCSVTGVVGPLSMGSDRDCSRNGKDGRMIRVQAPTGFDGALQKPAKWLDFCNLLSTQMDPSLPHHSMTIIMR